MKKILFILLALPMLWGCKEDSEEAARRERMAKAEKIFAEVMAEAGDYDVAHAEEMLANTFWQLNTNARYNADWSELIAAGRVDGEYPPPPPGAIVDPAIWDFSLLSDGRVCLEYPHPEQHYQTWAFDAETRTLTFIYDYEKSDDVCRVVALSDEWLILEIDREHRRLLFEGHAIVGLDE